MGKGGSLRASGQNMLEEEQGGGLRGRG